MTQAAVNYAYALYDLAEAEGLCEELDGQLEVLRACFSETPSFLRLLSAPEISKEERCRIADSSFRETVHPYVRNLMKLLIEKGRVHIFPQCCKVYREIVDDRHGILPVYAYTAVALSPEQSRRLRKKLESSTGKSVRLVNRKDPDCLGGVRLRFDRKQVDGTVKHQLEAVAALLNKTVL